MSNNLEKLLILEFDTEFKVGNYIVEADNLVELADQAKKQNFSLHIVGNVETARLKNPVEIILLEFDAANENFKQEFLFKELQKGALTEDILSVVERRT